MKNVAALGVVVVNSQKFTTYFKELVTLSSLDMLIYLPLPICDGFEDTDLSLQEQ